ncbi:MAG TPA: SDR family oxidoreductase [Dongiaceae bacterium]|jgi:NAD(P)-dependent dehydrogenase (short-subunit alcohol dehydrogenase family)
MAQTILITGGGRGIGAATAVAAARAGYDVAISYKRDGQRADAVLADIKALGRKGFALQSDAAKEEDVLSLFARLDKELGPLNALVNNAGITGTAVRVENVDAAVINEVLAANITGSFLCAREAVKRMSTRRGGRGGAIVNISSAAARHGSPGEYVHYAASKGAIDTFTVGLAKEVADEGIRVNAIRPGLIDTEIHAASGIPDRLSRIVPLVPMKRVGQAEEVAAAVLWLLSDAASYVTGTILDVSGGR